MSSIAEIKKVFASTDLSDYDRLFEEYAGDDREGVKKILESAHRKKKAYDDEKIRMYKMFEYERKYSDNEFICGIDEVGRGPLAGPVVAGAVILPEDCQILYLNDSKKLTERRRELLYEEIMEKAVAVGLGVVSQERIDEINILQATYEAMREAVGKLDPQPEILLNDAVTIPGLSQRQIPIIKGDAKSQSIAAASVVAKVTRDHMMIALDEAYPQYGFASNKGYGSAAHMAALREYGPCPLHRRTFIRNICG